MAFHNLTQPQKDAFLDYELMVYVCDGNDQDKLDWFRTINIAGEKLTEQELRNAVYTGPWLTTPSRSSAGPTALPATWPAGTSTARRSGRSSWRPPWNGSAGATASAVEDYMSAHQHDPNANALWSYFQNVIEWAQRTFTTYRKEMKGVVWGPLYGAYKEDVIDSAAIEARVATLMQDPDVKRSKGIYTYALTGEEKYLNLRQFDERERQAALSVRRATARTARSARPPVTPTARWCSRSRAWMPTTSCPGRRVARPTLATARCSASRVTAPRGTSRSSENGFEQRSAPLLGPAGERQPRDGPDARCGCQGSISLTPIGWAWQSASAMLGGTDAGHDPALARWRLASPTSGRADPPHLPVSWDACPRTLPRAEG